MPSRTLAKLCYVVSTDEASDTSDKEGAASGSGDDESSEEANSDSGGAPAVAPSTPTKKQKLETVPKAPAVGKRHLHSSAWIHLNGLSSMNQ